MNKLLIICLLRAKPQQNVLFISISKEAGLPSALVLFLLLLSLLVRKFTFSRVHIYLKQILLSFD